MRTTVLVTVMLTLAAALLASPPAATVDETAIKPNIVWMNFSKFQPILPAPLSTISQAVGSSAEAEHHRGGLFWAEWDHVRVARPALFREAR